MFEHIFCFFYLTFYLTSILTVYVALYLTCIPTFYLASYLIYSGALTDIHSDISSGILSDILFSWGSGQEDDTRRAKGPTCSWLCSIHVGALHQCQPNITSALLHLYRHHAAKSAGYSHWMLWSSNLAEWCHMLAASCWIHINIFGLKRLPSNISKKATWYMPYHISQQVYLTYASAISSDNFSAILSEWKRRFCVVHCSGPAGTTAI